MYHHRSLNLRTYNHQFTREENLKLLFDLINKESGVTRAELVRLTGLSPSTVSSLVDDLVRSGLVTELGLARMAQGAGRRPIMLDIDPDSRQIPVFSLSMWGVSYTLFDLGYNVIEQSFRPCPPEIVDNDDCWPDTRDSGDKYTMIFEDILARSKKYDKTRSVGVLISYPGVYIHEEDLFILTSLQESFKKSVIDSFESSIGLPVFMGNSSMNLAYAEKKCRDASGAEVNDLIYINICEGVGAGIICDGETLVREDRIAGEIGHVTVVIGGRSCSCGNKGCLERYVNINAIKNAVTSAVGKDKSGDFGDDIRSILEAPTLEAIGRAYDNGVPVVLDVMDGIAEKLFAGIYSTVNVTGVKLVVIGGLEKMGDKFLNRLRSYLDGKTGQRLMRGVVLTFPETDPRADSVGIAQYYIDNVFRITD